MSKPAFTALAALSLVFAVGCSAGNSDDVASDTAHVETSTLVYDNAAPVKLQPVGGREADRLKAKLFVDGYRSSSDECDAKVADAAIVPTVNGRIAGSFTGNGRNETLYIISVEDCNASHADGYGTTRFVVTEPITSPSAELKVLANAEYPGVGASINRIVDLDHDGQNELVVTEGYTGQGYTTESVELMRFAGSNLVKDQAFVDFTATIATPEDDSPFLADDCNAGFGDSPSVKSATIFATSQGGHLAFTAQKHVAACPPSQEDKQ